MADEREALRQKIDELKAELNGATEFWGRFAGAGKIVDGAEEHVRSLEEKIVECETKLRAMDDDARRT